MPAPTQQSEGGPARGSLPPLSLRQVNFSEGWPGPASAIAGLYWLTLLPNP